MTGPAAELVVDASVAVKWHLRDEDLVAEADKAAVKAVAGNLIPHAPDYIYVEVCAAIAFASTGNKPRISPAQAQLEIASFLTTPLRVTPSAELALDAFALVHRHGCAFYDALYLALANRLGISFITADHRLYQHIRRLPNVIWLGD